jgi:hypothetical protein
MELFGDLSVPAKILIAVVVALATLGAVGYLTRWFRPTRTEPRLAVIDAASVDGLRRLVLVRRDDAEHLLLIGGATDVVIEPNIGRTGAAATAPAPVREPRASPPPREPIARQPLSREAVMAREPKTREPMTRESMTRDATLRPPPTPIELQRLETCPTLDRRCGLHSNWRLVPRRRRNRNARRRRGCSSGRPRTTNPFSLKWRCGCRRASLARQDGPRALPGRPHSQTPFRGCGNLV